MVAWGFRSGQLLYDRLLVHVFLPGGGQLVGAEYLGEVGVRLSVDVVDRVPGPVLHLERYLPVLSYPAEN